MQKTNKMGDAPMLQLIAGMSLPAMFSMLIQALYNIVDSVFVSQLGEDALTAVSLAFPIQMLIISFAVGTGVGLNSLVSRRLGERRQADADAAATHGMILGAASWVIFAIVGGLFTRPFIALFSGGNNTVLDMGSEYLWVCIVFSFGVFLELPAEKTLQATGNMIFPMLFQLTGAILNIALDPIFIFGLLGVPAFGVKGAAIATVLGQIGSMLFALCIIFFKKHDIHITFRKFRWHWRIVRDIYAVGVPSIIMQSIGSFLVMGLNAILAQFQSAVAVLGIYFKLQSFVFMPVFGLTQGILPIMGYNYGARNKQRLMHALKIGTIAAIVIMTAGTLLFWLGTDWLLSLFQATPEQAPNMYATGVDALHMISLSFIPAAVGILFSTLFQATGFGVRSLIVSVLRQLVVILPCAWAFSFISVHAVWYAFPLAEVVSFIVSLLLFWSLYNQHIRSLTPEAAV